jgi:predicted alpha/beta-hydrolase family hydrolase
VSDSKHTDSMTVDLGAGAATTALVYGKQGPPAGASLIVAHGAGGGQRSSFIVDFAAALAARGIDVVTFNFLYTEQGRRMPDRAPLLEQCYQAVVETVASRVAAPGTLFIGGKSMGGRIATQLAAQQPSLPLAGIVCLGYPLHPPGQPQRLRDAHLPLLRTPTLVVQGSADTFGTPGELAPVLARMAPAPTLHVIEGGDHSFKVRGGKAAQAAVFERICRTVADWITGLTSRDR